jgi:hypothetical protein
MLQPQEKRKSRMFHGQTRTPSLTPLARKFLSIPTPGNLKLSLRPLLQTGARLKHLLWAESPADGVPHRQKLEAKETIELQLQPRAHGWTRLLVDRLLALATSQTGILPPLVETLRRKTGNPRQERIFGSQPAHRRPGPGDRLPKTFGRTMIRRSHRWNQSHQRRRPSLAQTHPGGVALGLPVIPQQSSKMMVGEIH